MKVLQVGKYYPPVDGGIENNVRALSVGLGTSCPRIRLIVRVHHMSIVR